MSERGEPNNVVFLYCLILLYDFPTFWVWAVPDEGYYVSDEGYYVPDEGYYVPDEGYYVPDEGYYVPDEGYYIPDEVYSRNASCALNLISTFLLFCFRF